MRTADLDSTYTAPPATQTATGWIHSCVLFEDQTVACMGATPMIGYGEEASSVGASSPASERPGPVSLGAPVTQIDSGHNHTCALTTQGQVVCWGVNGNSQLGYPEGKGNVGDKSVPSQAGFVPLPEPGIAQQISMGGARSCALLQGGTAACWNAPLQVDNGDTDSDTEPDNPRETDTDTGEPQPSLDETDYMVEIAFDEAFTQISTGALFTAAVTETGRLVYWMDGTEVKPYPLGDGVAALEVALGGIQSCVLFTDGRVKCWSTIEEHWNLGPPDTDSSSESPPFVDLGEGATAVQVAAGQDHSCAVLADGSLRCWGSNASGQLGLPGTDVIGDDETPAEVNPVDVGGRVVHVSCGSEHTCATLENGRVVCWGEADYGRLGYGNNADIGKTNTPASAGTVPL